LTVTETINHPFLQEGIEPRLFQQTILSTCINKNTLVVLPTGTGKTIIAILHVAYLLQNNAFPEGSNKFILILAPTKPLINQHVKSLRSFLKIPKNEIVELSGAISPDKRKHIIKNAKIIVATPQTIRNDIIHNHIDTKNCILTYFDEAHRARGEYDYVHIADIIQKYNPDSRFIALTASPGTNKDSILEICRNLFIETVESRPRDNPEVMQYIQDVEIEKIEIPLPQEFEELLEIVDTLGERETEFLRKSGLTNKKFAYLYKTELLRLKKELSKNFKANYLEMMASNRLIFIQILKETLESQGIPSAHTLLAGWKEKNSKSIRGLLKLEEFQALDEKIDALKEQGIIHPKLLHLVDILDRVDMINSKVLIFCNLRATSFAISEALNERGIDAKPFVGQGGKKQGFTQKKQLAIINAFRNNKFPVLVSTSVLEEGLDVDECNLVIFYDSTASAIRKIQRIGRTGRKQKGKVIVLTTHHTIDTALHYVSNSRERKMNSLLANIDWLNRELAKEKPKDTRAFAPETHEVVESMEPTEPEEEIEVVEEADINLETNEKLSSFKIAIKDVEKWTDEAPVESKDEETKKEKTKDDAVKIIVDSREKNSKILFYLKKQGIDLEFKQLDCADYVVSDRTAIEYKKGEDLLSSIIDGRLFEQLGSICNAYQIPILLIEGFPSGGIHPEAIAGALSSFMIDFGVSIIQTQSSEESAVILKRLAIREQKTKKRKALIRKAFKISNPRENALSVLSSFPGINRVLATRMLEKLKSVKGVINASKEDLNEIEGMGVKKSKKFTELAMETYD